MDGLTVDVLQIATRMRRLSTWALASPWKFAAHHTRTTAPKGNAPSSDRHHGALAPTRGSLLACGRWFRHEHGREHGCQLSQRLRLPYSFSLSVLPATPISLFCGVTLLIKRGLYPLVTSLHIRLDLHFGFSSTLRLPAPLEQRHRWPLHARSVVLVTTNSAWSTPVPAFTFVLVLIGLLLSPFRMHWSTLLRSIPARTASLQIRLRFHCLAPFFTSDTSWRWLIKPSVAPIDSSLHVRLGFHWLAPFGSSQ